jgi:hypothetical protein
VATSEPFWQAYSGEMIQQQCCKITLRVALQGRHFVMSKFHGSLLELQAIVAACNIRGEWLENTTNRFYRFRADTGEILNW